MKETESLAKSFLLFTWSIITTMMTFVFGGIFFHGLYRLLGRGLYWLSFLGVSCLAFGMGFKLMALCFGAMTILIGVFNEFRDSGSKILTAGLTATFFTTSLISVISFYSFKTLGPNWHEQVVANTSEYLKGLLPPNSDFLNQVKVADIINQLPSGMFIVFVFTIFITILFEKRMFDWINRNTKRKERVLNFKLPDNFIWLFIGSLLAAFIRTDSIGINIIGANVLNGIMVLYFLQGLAIVATYFHVMKVGNLWRVIFYVLLFTQLFLLVAAIGIIDFWIDLRRRLYKKVGLLKETSSTKNF